MAVAGRVGQLAYQGRSLWHALRAWVAAHPSVACAKGGSVSELTSPPLTWPLTDCLSLKDSRFKYFRNHELYECSRMAASWSMSQAVRLTRQHSWQFVWFVVVKVFFSPSVDSACQWQFRKLGDIVWHLSLTLLLTITYKNIKSTKNRLTANVGDGMVAIIGNVEKSILRSTKGRWNNLGNWEILCWQLIFNSITDNNL